MTNELNRRGFFGALFGAAAIAADPEKLLWEPGKKLISIAPAKIIPPTILPIGGDVFRVGDIFTLGGYYSVNPVTREATRHKQLFVVRDVATSGILFAPHIELEGRYQNAIVKGKPSVKPMPIKRLYQRDGL